MKQYEIQVVHKAPNGTYGQFHYFNMVLSGTSKKQVKDFARQVISEMAKEDFNAMCDCPEICVPFKSYFHDLKTPVGENEKMFGYCINLL